MTASDTSPTEGYESGGESALEQRVLRQFLKGHLEMVADDVRYQDGDLDELLVCLRRARAELSVMETLVMQYVDETEESDE